MTEGRAGCRQSTRPPTHPRSTYCAHGTLLAPFNLLQDHLPEKPLDFHSMSSLTQNSECLCPNRVRQNGVWPQSAAQGEPCTPLGASHRPWRRALLSGRAGRQCAGQAQCLGFTHWVLALAANREM